MTRRGLFQFFTAAAIAADPDKLLWTPGQRTISIPRPVTSADLELTADKLYLLLQGIEWSHRPNTSASAFGEAHAVLASALTGMSLTNPPPMTDLSKRVINKAVDCRGFY